MQELNQDVCRCEGGVLRGTVRIPPSKSAAHRAMLCAALAEGRSVLSPIELSDDMRATLNVMTALGAKSSLQGDTLVIHGMGGRTGNGDSELTEFHCIESGSTLRFIIPVACAAGINGRFTGSGSLLTRPIGMYRELLPQAGVSCETDGRLPCVCRGRLRAGAYRMPGDVSSQFITGMLLALPLCEGDSDITLTTPLQSAGYVELTLQCMADFGVTVERTPDGWHIPGGQRYRARRYDVEGDWSHAGFFLAAGALGGDLRLRGLRTDSTQGDRAAAELFRRFGAQVTEEDGGLRVRPGSLRGQHIDASQIPDLVPCLAVCAALCKGTTVIDHAERLRIKESDRLVSTAAMLLALGGRVEMLPDGLRIEGVERFTGGTVDGYRDHRIIMAAAVAALRAAGGVDITTPGSVRKSFPSFFDVYNSLGGNAHVIHMG